MDEKLSAKKECSQCDMHSFRVFYDLILADNASGQGIMPLICR